MSPKSVVMLFGVVLFIIGVVFFALSHFFYISIQKRQKNCVSSAVATIVEIQQVTSSATGDGIPTTSWYPVYEYDVGGQTIRKRSSYGFARDKYSVGQRVEIKYNPYDYNEFYNPSDQSRKMIIAFQWIGILLMVAGVACLVLWEKIL